MAKHLSKAAFYNTGNEKGVHVDWMIFKRGDKHVIFQWKNKPPLLDLTWSLHAPQNFA